MVNLFLIYNEFKFLRFDFGLDVANTVQQSPVLVSDRACFCLFFFDKWGKRERFDFQKMPA